VPIPEGQRCGPLARLVSRCGNYLEQQDPLAPEDQHSCQEARNELEHRRKGVANLRVPRPDVAGLLLVRQWTDE